ncbi:PAAR domain-containing protein [Xenorhabdus sp. SGI246]|uniref:PAAR domain-containing protein n=1 Tax=Xenorhabdus sp. SGI246 TaxID=3158263 RepID=UPI00349FBEDF
MMAIGYFLVVGDQTTCGGAILTGSSQVTFYGKQSALEGSSVSCGRYGGSYQIIGGVSGFLNHQKKMAGTLDSRSSCPCQAGLIHSIPDSYSN